MTSTLESVAKTSVKLLLKEPFYGHVMSVLVKKINNDISTMGLSFTPDERIELNINESFWSEISVNPEYQYGILKHEILHFVFKHLLMSDSYQHKIIFNIAADIVVNQLIHSQQLPSGALRLNCFSSLELLEKQSLKYYYEKILTLYRNNVSDVQSGSNDSKKNSKEKQDWQKLKNMLDRYPKVLQSHDAWKPIQSDSQKQLFKSAIDTLITQSSDKLTREQLLSLHSSLRKQITLSASRNSPLLNWRRVMRMFTNNSSKTYMKNSIRRASKRYGTVPGNKIQKRNKLLVAIDSSGSIMENEYQVFFSELYHIYKTGAEIRVVECDTEITNTYNYKGTTPEVVVGGGGTDFNAPLDYANTQWLPDAIIYFTDGGAPTPRIIPRTSVLWVISQQGIEPSSDLWNLLPGQKIQITV